MSTTSAFHVTPKANLDSILKEGITPHIGERSDKLGESTPAVYLFCSMKECENALWNWLGEEFEELEDDLLILEVAIDDNQLQRDTNGDVFFEIAVNDTIPANNIINIYTEQYNPAKASYEPYQPETPHLRRKGFKI